MAQNIVSWLTKHKVGGIVAGLAAVIGIISGAIAIGEKLNSGPGSLEGVTITTTSTPASFRRRCPFRVRLNAEISVASGSGTVEYRAVLLDDRTQADIRGPLSRVRFDGGGSKVVTGEFVVQRSLSGAGRIVVESPETQASSGTPISAICVA